MRADSLEAETMVSGNSINQNRNIRIRGLAVLFILISAAGALRAQVTASVTGTVKDSSGAVVPGAAVTIKSLESGLARTTETDANGNYSAPSLPVGEYEVAVERSG